MSEEHSFEWLYEQYRLLLKRIERLEGRHEALSRQIIPPAMIYPKRSEFDALELRISKLEKPSGTGQP